MVEGDNSKKRYRGPEGSSRALWARTERAHQAACIKLETAKEDMDIIDIAIVHNGLRPDRIIGKSRVLRKR